MNGALFVTSEPLEINSSILLRLAHPRRDFSTTRESKVVRCESEHSGQWKVTCCFDRCLSLDDVIQLGNAWMS
jgi:hypothetical protein